MGNKSQNGLAIHTENSYYLPGEVVQGKIYINTVKPYPCEKIILHVVGIQKSWFRENTGNELGNTSISSASSLQSVQPGRRKNIKINSRTGEQSGQNKIIQAFITLVSWNKDSHLHGQYVFPFFFQLPSYIPGSFHEENVNYRASIKYQIRAICLSPKKNFSNIESQIEVIIREPQRNKQQSMYGQIFVYPISCGCRKHGVSRICCYFEKNQYMPGQDCIAICEADNYKCSLPINEIKVQFYKQIVLVSTFGEQRQYIKEIRSVSFPGIGSSGMYTGENAQRIHLPLKYNDQKAVIHPSTQGRLIRCSYFLQVTPVFSGCCVPNSNYFRINLNILQEGIIQPKIEQPQNWDPKVFQESQVFFNEGNATNENLNKMNEYEQ